LSSNLTPKKFCELETLAREVDPAVYRKDDCGAWICFSNYGDTSSETNFGWEIDLITSTAHNGPDCFSNLRPLHWKNNRVKGATRLKPAVTAEGDHNIILGNN